MFDEWGKVVSIWFTRIGTSCKLIYVTKKIVSIPIFIVISILMLALQVGSRPEITSPEPDEVLQGVVLITGTADMIGLQSYEVLFSYAKDATDTWFLIEQGTKPVKNESLALWDTTTITDGEYRLMLRVHLDDSAPIEAVVPGLRVRNYSPIETATPAPTSIAGGFSDSGDENGPEFGPTPTDLPSNPAVVTTTSLVNSILKGMAYALVGLIVIGGFFAVRMMTRRR